MAVNKPGKAEILAAFFDDGTYSPLFTDGAVSAAYGCANGQNAYVVFEDGSPVGVQDIEKEYPRAGDGRRDRRTGCYVL